MNEEELNVFFSDVVRRSFVESLYRPASEQDVDAYVERMNQLYISATTEDRGQLQAAFNDLLFTAANAGIDLREVEGADKVIQFIENRNKQIQNSESAQQYIGRSTVTPISEEMQTIFTGVIAEVIGGIVGFSKEAWGKKSQINQLASQANKLSQGTFNVQKYLELNTDVADAARNRFGAYETEEATRYFSLLHYVQHGYGEGRLTAEAIPEAEPEIEEPQPQLPSFGGGGFSMPDMSNIFNAVSGSNNRVADLTSQLNSYIGNIASQPQQPIPEPTIPLAPAPISSGNVLQPVSVARSDRGLTQYTGFNDVGMTYLQSITQRGRQSTFRRAL